MDLFFRKIIEQLRKETDQSIVTHCDKMSILLRKFNFQSYKKMSILILAPKIIDFQINQTLNFHAKIVTENWILPQCDLTEFSFELENSENDLNNQESKNSHIKSHHLRTFEKKTFASNDFQVQFYVYAILQFYAFLETIWKGNGRRKFVCLIWFWHFFLDSWNIKSNFHPDFHQVF